MSFPTALLTVRQMSEADGLTVAAGSTVAQLSLRAGRSVAQAIGQRWSPRPVIVLCGPGNNGGDGVVAATSLAQAGWPVRLALLGPHDHVAGWRGPIESLAPQALDGAELVVDAIFGAGLSRALEGAAAETLLAAAARGLDLVAIDVPSGVMGDSGASLGAVAAQLTVTFFRKKPGHVLLPGRSLCGEVVVSDIGTPDSVFTRIHPDIFENDPSLWLASLPRPRADGNKYDRGHALICGGYPMTGAARMAARAAARAGAGLTSIAVSEAALAVYAAALTSIMVLPVATPAEFHSLLNDPRLSAFLIGPGAGVSDETRSRAMAMLATGRPTLLDADAITCFQDDRQALLDGIIGPCVLTPHDGEFLRLFDAEGDKICRSRRAANLIGAVILLKGCDSVIAAPDGRAIINSNAPAILATAGAGDVLSGILLGLLAQGVEPFLAAAAAAWLQGAAASRFGPGLIAEDLPDLLPGVLRTLFGTEGDGHAGDGTEPSRSAAGMDRPA
jgi:NAD(P)H-hydrate epimerase